MHVGKGQEMWEVDKRGLRGGEFDARAWSHSVVGDCRIQPLLWIEEKA